MTAGSGILHQEMPKGDPQGRMHGFQLWANLPSSLKMTAPRYQDVSGADVPEVIDDDGTRVRVVCGEFWGKTGPVDGIAADPRYLDVWVPRGPAQDAAGGNAATRSPTFLQAPDRSATRPIRGPVQDRSRRRDRDTVRPADDIGNRSLVLFDRGDEVTVQAGDEGIRFLLVSGKPIEEPVAWYGPIVMNTQEELRQAISELNRAPSSSSGKRTERFMPYPEMFVAPMREELSQFRSARAEIRAGRGRGGDRHSRHADDRREFGVRLRRR